MITALVAITSGKDELVEPEGHVSHLVGCESARFHQVKVDPASVGASQLVIIEVADILIVVLVVDIMFVDIVAKFAGKAKEGGLLLTWVNIFLESRKAW